MSRLTRLNGPQIIGRLEKAGFFVVRVRGSHHRLTHPDGRSTTVPVHGVETIGPGLLLKILKDCCLDRAAFETLR
jgi:predicted RNA binding protein YcfA (HicA-like mRNA interferase family)